MCAHIHYFDNKKTGEILLQNDIIQKYICIIVQWNNILVYKIHFVI